LSVTQLCTYFVGYEEWRGLVEAGRKAGGGSFNERSFLDRALRYGGGALPSLRALILAGGLGGRAPAPPFVPTPPFPGKIGSERARKAPWSANGRLASEVLGGVTTFLTMSYIVVVNPSILATPGTGLRFSAVLTATVLCAASMTMLMGLVARLPFGVAP